MVIRINKPCAKFVKRCSTTRSTYASCLFSFRIFADAEDAERCCMEGGLGDESIGEREAEKASDSSNEFEEKKSQSDVLLGGE